MKKNNSKILKIIVEIKKMVLILYCYVGEPVFTVQYGFLTMNIT